jgi:hypothetical protein
MGPNKMNKWIGKHYGETVPVSHPHSDYISFVVKDSIPPDQVAVTEKTHQSFVPALFYWQWNHTMLSTVNFGVHMNNFSTEFISYANDKGLKNKLNGNTLQLTITANPVNYTFTQKGHLIFLLLYYISSESLYIMPDKNRVSFSYKVMNGANEVKTGSVSIANMNREVALAFFQSSKKMTWKYLEESDNNIKLMSRELVDKLMTEL